MLTPPSDLPELPNGIPGYLQLHLYTLTQLIVTGVVFYITLTVAGPAFPVVIIALVPTRLLIMNRIWSPDVLKYVDAWACREGCPEDDRDPGPEGIGDSPEAVERCAVCNDADRLPVVAGIRPV